MRRRNNLTPLISLRVYFDHVPDGALINADCKLKCTQGWFMFRCWYYTHHLLIPAAHLRKIMIRSCVRTYLQICANYAVCHVFNMLESMRCRPRLLLQSAKTDEVEREARETSANREMTERVKFKANGKRKREFLPRDQFSLNLCFTAHYFYPQISSFTLVLSVTIVLDCF